MSIKDRTFTKLSPRTWFILTMLAVTGQIAWAIENCWFNPFVVDTLTPDLRPVAWMVGVNAITATLITLIMGILSARTRAKRGRSKPYIPFWLYPLGCSYRALPHGGIRQNYQCSSDDGRGR